MLTVILKKYVSHMCMSYIAKKILMYTEDKNSLFIFKTFCW